nr:hypothetical protein BaRGS_027223 [Batillaria attramentaria]
MLQERHALVLILLAVLQLSLAVFTLIEDRWHGGFKAEVKLEAPVELQNWTVHLVFDQPVEGLLVPSVWQYDVTELSSLEYLVHSEEWNAHVRAGRKLTLHIAGTPQSHATPVTHIKDTYNRRGEYDFVFHHTHDLLLVITENDCYTISMGDDDIIVLWINHRHSFMVKVILTYMSVLEKTIEHEPDKVIHSSLLEMRKTYGDLLADYHCLDKRVGHVAIDEEILYYYYYYHHHHYYYYYYHHYYYYYYHHHHQHHYYYFYYYHHYYFYYYYYYYHHYYHHHHHHHHHYYYYYYHHHHHYYYYYTSTLLLLI